MSTPPFIYGTAWKKEATTELVKLAVQKGFSAIDTANQAIHYSEPLVGEALRKLAQEACPRSSLWLQTKFTPLRSQGDSPPYDPKASLTKQVQQSCESSLMHLHTDVIDSYLLHGPYGHLALDERDFEVWEAMEALCDDGKVRQIGVSNVSAQQLRQLLEGARIAPTAAQIRTYAERGWERETRAVCRDHGVVFQGFSLLTANRYLQSDADMLSIAKKYDATVSQVIFRFSIQVGMTPITGTTNPEHMEQDLRCMEFELSDREVARIEKVAR